MSQTATTNCPTTLEEPQLSEEELLWLSGHAAQGEAVLPQRYADMSEAELDRRISAAKEALGSGLVVLGHHYQRDEIIKFADYTGDSLRLSQLAAGRAEAEFIVFCGVHFMAESADILSAPSQKVILPNLAAGCSLADMASLADVEECCAYLAEAGCEKVVPVTYINSTADIKAFCGRSGGSVCTSSNAGAVFRWAFERGEQVLFLPDQHLGRNTALKLGLNLADTVVWDPGATSGGCDAESLRRCRMVLWKGHCLVHQRFTVAQVRLAREKYPAIKVIVHPECCMEVAQLADYVGSTEYIVKTVSAAPSGTQWAVGTEINLVHRLATRHPDKLIFCLDPVVCPCSTMYRIHPAYLAWVLEGLVRGEVINRVSVEPEVARWARVALDRMLSLA